MHTAKYKNNPKDAKKDKRLLFINPLNIELASQDVNTICEESEDAPLDEEETFIN